MAVNEGTRRCSLLLVQAQVFAHGAGRIWSLFRSRPLCKRFVKRVFVLRRHVTQTQHPPPKIRSSVNIADYGLCRWGFRTPMCFSLDACGESISGPLQIGRVIPPERARRITFRCLRQAWVARARRHGCLRVAVSRATEETQRRFAQHTTCWAHLNRATRTTFAEWRC